MNFSSDDNAYTERMKLFIRLHNQLVTRQYLWFYNSLMGKIILHKMFPTKVNEVNIACTQVITGIVTNAVLIIRSVHV